MPYSGIEPVLVLFVTFLFTSAIVIMLNETNQGQVIILAFLLSSTTVLNILNIFYYTKKEKDN